MGNKSETNEQTGWGEPPPDGRSKGGLSAWLNSLKQRPGEWGWRQYRSAMSCGPTVAEMRRMGFEAVTRGSRVYARWVVTP